MSKCFYKLLVFILFYTGFIGLSPMCSATSRHLILITHWQQERKAMLIKKRLIDDLGIPSTAIDVLEQFNPCEKVFDALYFLCVVDGDDLFKVVISQQLFFREAFGHLLASPSIHRTEAP